MKKGQHPRKWSKEQKLEIIKKHLNEHISIRALGKEYDADSRNAVIRFFIAILLF